MFEAIASLEIKPAFIVHLGDMVYDGADENDWQYFDKYTSLARNKKIPILPVLGNHEYFGNFNKSMKNIVSRFEDLNDTSWRSFKFKNVGLILLNSNIELSEAQRIRQKRLYNLKLELFELDSNIVHILVVTHHPPYTNGKGICFNGSQFVRENFLSSFQKSKKASLFLSGHCHNYEHLIVEGNQYLVSGGGGGPRRKIDLNGECTDITKGKESNITERDIHYVEVIVKVKTLEFRTHIYNKESKFWGIGDVFNIPN